MAETKERASNTTSIRLDPELRRRLEALAASMGAAAGGVEINLAMAMRACIERGLPIIEKEIGARRAKR